MFALSGVIPGNNSRRGCLSFAIPTSIDSKKVFDYQVSTDNYEDIKTAFVTGLDNNIHMYFNTDADNKDNTNSHDSGDYFITLLRLPFISCRLIDDKYFSNPLLPVRYTDTQGLSDVWHILGVKKNAQNRNFKNLMGVTINGTFYQKQVYRLSGRISKEFYQTLAMTMVAASSQARSITNEQIDFNFDDIIINHI